MAFYGNVTDTSHTHFQFDKIFSSRTEMDRACALGEDGIYAGRFVLVKYDTQNGVFQGDILYGFRSGRTGDNALYMDTACTQPYIFTTYSLVTSNNTVSTKWNRYYDKATSGNFYFRLPSADYFNDEKDYWVSDLEEADDAERSDIIGINTIVRLKDVNTPGIITSKFLRCIGTTNGENAIWEEVIDDQVYQDYYTNFQLDLSTYQGAFDSRGYDATVWQKVYGEGAGKFVLIARLNGTTPAFELVGDPPSVDPFVPYIDAKSTDSLYRVHVPSKWGFQIKEAELINNEYPLSDQDVIRDGRSIPAEIYFNKKGFNYIERNKDTTTQNEVLITPTGKSGNSYYDKNGNLLTDQEDMYELAIHLPIVGNIFSDFYDQYYGQNRNLDIYWYNGDSSLKQNGNGSYNYKTRDLNTVAGSINVFHDRLGQVVVPVNQPLNSTNIAELSDEYIYVYNNSADGSSVYYRIGDGYEFEEIPSQNISYENIGTLTEAEYAPNNYYISNGSGGYTIASYAYSYYPNNQIFYKKNVSAVKFEEVQLLRYVANTYYYKEGENYYLDRTVDVPLSYTQPYFLITSANETQHTFDAAYQANLFYIKDEDNYILATEVIPDPTETYYSFTANQLSSGNRRLYRPGVYYYFENYNGNTPIGAPMLDSGDFQGSRLYWDIPKSDEIVYIYDSTTGQTIVGHALDMSRAQQVNLFWPQNVDVNSVYAKNGNTYIPISALQESSIEYQWYSLSGITEITSFYLPGVYYEKINNNYTIANGQFGGSSYVYYSLSNITPLTIPFYQGGKYYYYNGSIYLIDTAITMPDPNEETRTYYKGTALYVLRDSSERWSYGFEWPEQAVYVPASVDLATREKVKKAFELPGLDNGQSSLNGSLLQINKTIGAREDGARDLTSLTGAINSAKDVLSSIDLNLIPGRILYVNDFGQIEVSSIKISDLENLINT